MNWLVCNSHGDATKEMFHYVGQRMNWLVCDSHEDAAKEMFHYDSRSLASDNDSEIQLSRNKISSRSEAFEMCQV